MDRATYRRIDIIKVISRVLLQEHNKLISTDEFDQLYDMDMEQLEDIKDSILRQILKDRELVK